MSDHSVRRILVFLLGLLMLGAAVLFGIAGHQFVAFGTLLGAFSLFVLSVMSEGP